MNVKLLRCPNCHTLVGKAIKELNKLKTPGVYEDFCPSCDRHGIFELVDLAIEPYDR